MKRAAFIAGLLFLLSVSHAYSRDECGAFAVNSTDDSLYWATKMCNQGGEPGPLGWSAARTALSACQENSNTPGACHFIQNGECVAGPGQDSGFASLVAYSSDHFVGCGRTEAAAEKAARGKCISKHPGVKCVVRMTLEY